MLNLLLSVGIAAADSLIKRHREENDTTYEYLDDHLRIVTYRNKGAFLGKGSKNPLLVMWASIALTVILGIVFIITLTHSGLKSLKLGLSLLLGGAFSNSYDRLRKGYVVDYIMFSKAPGFIKNIVFNLSDFAIIIGALISALH